MNVIEVSIFYPGNFGAPGKPRFDKKKVTPEDIARQNESNKSKKLQRLILANFENGWHIILKYKSGRSPDTYEEAKKDLEKFLAAMRKAYKKKGIQFKYIACTERGKRTAVLHHHLIIEDIRDPVDAVRKVKELWDGNAAFFEMYEDGEYRKLAEYIGKKETKEESGWCTYTRSRNLIIPKPKPKIYKRKSWPEEPKPPKGWYIIKDSLINGENPVTKYPYQHYFMRRFPLPENGEKQKGNDG